MPPDVPPDDSFKHYSLAVLSSSESARKVVALLGRPTTDAWALGGAASSVSRELSADGSGFYMFGGLSVRTVRALVADVATLSAADMEVIGNTTPAAEVARLRGAGDSCRRQLPLCERGFLRVENAAIRAAGRAAALLPGVRAAAASILELCCVLGNVLSMRYESVFNVLLCSLAGAAQQLAHTDLRAWRRVGDSPRVLGALVSFMPGTTLPIWPGPRLARKVGALGEPLILSIPPGFVIIFRGDGIHTGAANESRFLHWRMHAYLVASTFVKRGSKSLDLDALLDTGLVGWETK